MKIPQQCGYCEDGGSRTSILLMYKSDHEMHSIQLFIQVEEAPTVGQSYLSSPKFFHVTTSCEFNLVQALENILGGDLVHYEIVGPGPWVTWTTLAKELKGQQLTLLYHDKPVPHTRTAVYGPDKMNTDLKQPVSMKSVSSRVNFIHAGETHLKVFNVAETVNLELPSDSSNSSTDSNNKSSGDSSDIGGRDLQSAFVEDNMKTLVYSAFSQDYTFTMDSQTQVKVPADCKSNLPENTQVLNIFPDKMQCAENNIKDHHIVNTEQNPSEALNDAPCFSIPKKNSSTISSNTQQNESTLHMNQKPDLYNIQKSLFQNTDNPNLHNDCQVRQNNLNNLSCNTLTSNSQSLFVRNSLDSQVVPKIEDSKKTDSFTVTRSGRMLSPGESVTNNATEVDDLSKKLSELPDVDLDISHTGSASTLLFKSEQNLQQINVTACSSSMDYVPHNCIESVLQQQLHVSSIGGLLECHNPGALGTPPPKRHRPSDITPLTTLLQQQHHQLYHQALLGKQTQRPNQLQLQQQQRSPQFTASDIDIQHQQQTSPQFSSSNSVKQQQQASPQFTPTDFAKQQQNAQCATSHIDMQQLQGQASSIQFIVSNTSIHQLQQQTAVSNTDVQLLQQQRTSVQLATSSNGQKQQQHRNQEQQQQQISPQFKTSSIGIQQLQQTSPQFTASRVDIQQQQQQQNSPQFIVSSIDTHRLQEHQISQHMTASAVGIQQKTSPLSATLYPGIQSNTSPQNSVSNLGWNLSQKSIEILQHQQQHSHSETELLKQSYLIHHAHGTSSPNIEELPNISSNTASEQMLMMQTQRKPILTLNSPEKQPEQQRHETVKLIGVSGQQATMLQPAATNFTNPGITSSSTRSLVSASVGQPSPAMLPNFEFTVRLPHPETTTRPSDSHLFVNTKNPSLDKTGSNSSSISLGSGGKFSQNGLNFVLRNEQSSQLPSQVTHPAILYRDVKVSATQAPGTNGSSRSRKDDVSEITVTDEEGYNVIDISNVSKGQLADTKWQRPATPKRSGFNLERELLLIEGWNPQENGDTIQNTMEKYRSQDGSFILWKSRRYNKFVITVSHLNKLLYFRVEETKNEKQDRTVYYLFEGGFRSESLLDLLQHYRQSGLKIPMQNSGAVKTYIEHIRLCYPVKPDTKRKDAAKPR